MSKRRWPVGTHMLRTPSSNATSWPSMSKCRVSVATNMPRPDVLQEVATGPHWHMEGTPSCTRCAGCGMTEHLISSRSTVGKRTCMLGANQLGVMVVLMSGALASRTCRLSRHSVSCASPARGGKHARISISPTSKSRAIVLVQASRKGRGKKAKGFGSRQQQAQRSTAKAKPQKGKLQASVSAKEYLSAFNQILSLIHI